MTNLSTTLRERVDATRSDIQELQTRLASLSTEKTALLASPMIDSKTLAKLELEESRIPSTIDSLRTRCDLLAGQIEEAERAEAVTRVAEIERALSELLPTLQAQHTEWIEGVKKLASLLEGNSKDHGRAKTLREEGAYLVERFGVAWPDTVPTPARPNITESDNLLRGKMWPTAGSGHWQQKTDELRKAKHAAAQAEAEQQQKRGRIRMVTSRPAPFTITHSTFAESGNA